MIKKLRYNIDARGLLRPGAPVIVGVSGGADSVALLAGLSELGYECIAAHCNYHLRGEESNRDMRHVQQLCSQMGVDLYVRDFDVDARRRATGESVEMACRELRYGWFADMLDRQRAQAIAVAHHREDNVETFFLNLMRGSSISGLTGMRWRNGYVVRPLLDVSRYEIERYLAERGIAHVDDSTNAESIFARNKLRNVVLPTLDGCFPGATDGILASITHLADNRELYDAAVADRSKLYFTGTEIALSRLIEGEGQLARLVLYEILRPLGFNMTHIDNILSSASRPGAHFAAGSTRLELDRGVIRVVGAAPTESDETEVTLRRDILAPANIVVTEHPVAEFRPERDQSTAYFDISVLDGDPRFVIRHWRRGDKFTPFGMKGSRLLSDIFSDAKYSAADKRAALLLTRDDRILWVIGLRASADFAIGPSTRRYLRLQIRN